MPILAYHGTTANEDFAKFEYTDDIGFHFGPRESANARLDQILAYCDDDARQGARILMCHLHIERPLRLPDCHTWATKNVLLALRNAGALTADSYAELCDDGYLDQDGFRAIVEAGGYDSVVYTNETEGGGDSYIVLRPEHITFALETAPAGRPTSKPRRPRP